MEKPITVTVEELKQGIVILVNNSNLPAFIVEHVLRDFADEARHQASIELERDKKEWLLSQKETVEEDAEE